MPAAPNPILLYDGVCGLCHRVVQFILRHDTHDRFRFAPLQSAFAGTLLRRHELNPDALDTVILVTNYAQPGEHLASRSAAVVIILRQLGGLWRALAVLLSLIPRPLRDWGYTCIAGNRYRIFGKFDACPIPKESDRPKFLDAP